MTVIPFCASIQCTAKYESGLKGRDQNDNLKIVGTSATLSGLVYERWEEQSFYPNAVRFDSEFHSPESTTLLSFHRALNLT